MFPLSVQFRVRPHRSGIEAVRGGAFTGLSEVKYTSDPRRFEQRVLDILRDHAPAVYTRVDVDRTFAVADRWTSATSQSRRPSAAATDDSATAGRSSRSATLTS